MPAVRGVISENGHVLAGVGFAMERTATGAYTIGFVEPFPDPPAVVVTAEEPGRIASVAPTNAGAEVRITDLSGRPADSGFSLIAEPSEPQG